MVLWRPLSENQVPFLKNNHSGPVHAFLILLPLHRWDAWYHYTASVMPGTLYSLKVLYHSHFKNSASVRGGTGPFDRGFDRKDAVTKPTGMYSQRPLANVPVPKIDRQSVCHNRLESTVPDGTVTIDLLRLRVTAHRPGFAKSLYSPRLVGPIGPGNVGVIGWPKRRKWRSSNAGQ